jgi:hypothetical protein
MIGLGVNDHDYPETTVTRTLEALLMWAMALWVSGFLAVLSTSWIPLFVWKNVEWNFFYSLVGLFMLAQGIFLVTIWSSVEHPQTQS